MLACMHAYQQPLSLMCSTLHVTAGPVSVCLLMQAICWRVREAFVGEFHEASVESPMLRCHHVTECRHASLFGGSTHPLLQGSAG